MTMAKTADTDTLRGAIRVLAPPFTTAIVFGFFINLLMFVSPLYMLQIYDRVLGARNLVTLGWITAIAAVLLMVWAALEILRSRLLVRGGILFDDCVAVAVFRAAHSRMLRRPETIGGQHLRDVDAIREFVTGAGLIAFSDLPWFPVFLGVSFLLHPWFGWIAVVGGAVTSFSLCSTRP